MAPSRPVAVHYLPSLPSPVVSSSTLRGRGARGGLREGDTYTWSVYVDHALGVARIESPLWQANEFDDYGRPSFPEQEAATRATLRDLGVASVSRWTTTTEIALADLPRVLDALAALLDGPQRSRPDAWYRGELTVGDEARRAFVVLFEAAPDAPCPELAVSCAPDAREAAVALLGELAPGAPVADDRPRERVVATLAPEADVAALHARLRARFPPR